MDQPAPERGAFRWLLTWPARRRLLLVAGLGVTVVGPLLAALVIAARSYRAEASVFRNHRRAVPLADGTATIPGLAAVSFRSADGTTLRGWYARAAGRAAVILTHGSGSDRRAVLAEAALLNKAGLAVLLFDFPGHGESDGQISWADGERAALVAALSFLQEQVEPPAQQIGVAGFSMGGVIASQVAASDARVAALALIGTPSDLEQQTHWEYRRWGWLSTAPALWALRRHGLDLTRDRPRTLIGKVAPRPLLIVQGSEDTVVPPFMADDLFAAAGEPKQQLVVHGAGHGNYLEVEPAQYAQALVAFFSRSLVPAP